MTLPPVAALCIFADTGMAQRRMQTASIGMDEEPFNQAKTPLRKSSICLSILFGNAARGLSLRESKAGMDTAG